MNFQRLTPQPKITPQKRFRFHMGLTFTVPEKIENPQLQGPSTMSFYYVLFCNYWCWAHQLFQTCLRIVSRYQTYLAKENIDCPQTVHWWIWVVGQEPIHRPETTRKYNHSTMEPRICSWFTWTLIWISSGWYVQLPNFGRGTFAVCPLQPQHSGLGLKNQRIDIRDELKSACGPHAM